MAREIITLSNGKRVANFSSPHSFTFTDGSEIPAVDAEESVRLKVTFNEDIDEDGDVKLDFTLSDAIIEEMRYWMKLWDSKEVDVVFCCLPMITAIKEDLHAFDEDCKVSSVLETQEMDEDGTLVTYYGSLKRSPFRSVRMEDRIEKLLSIEKQCI